MKLLLRQVNVCDPQSEFHGRTVDLLIANGSIAAVDNQLEADADQVIAATGLYVSRGWTDIFADYREPGFEHKETIASGLDTAAAGGFTKVLIAPNTQPVLSNKAAIQYVLQRAAGHAVQLLPFGALSQQAEGKELAEMLDMRAFGAIAFTDGWKPVQNANLMLKALEYVKAFNGVLLQVPVDTAISAGGLMHEGIVSTRIGMAGIPCLAETLMVHRDIELAKYAGSRIHISGISAADSVALIRKAKAEGVQVTCSVTPYHLALNDEALSGYSSMYKVMPPLRTEADRQALIAGIEDGTIDAIASHHRPQEWDAKAKEFEYAADGMNLQQQAFQVAYEALKDTVSLDRIIAAFTTAPAAIFGLDQVAIGKGNKADLTLFTLNGSERSTKYHSLSANNPFRENTFSAAITGIINNDKIVFN